MNTNLANTNKHLNIYLSMNMNIYGVVHISHGMAEHVGRYKWLISKFNQEGYHVYAANHRGHGSWINTDNPKGFFAENNGWQHVTQDLIAVIQKAQTDHPNLKHYLLGHSMGSWIALSAVQENIKIDGLVMCGSAKLDNFSILVQSILINIIYFFKGKHHYSLLMDKLTMRRYNNLFKPFKSPNDWISSDTESVKDYTDDINCGFIVTIGLWKDLVTGFKKVFSLKYYKNISFNVPIFIISGDKDPVGGNGKLVRDLYLFLNSIFTNVSMALIKDSRHEVLTEINKEESFLKIINFFKNN